MHTRYARVSVVAHAACHEPRSGPPDKLRSQSEPRRHERPTPSSLLGNTSPYQASIKSQLSTITAWATTTTTTTTTGDNDDVDNDDDDDDDDNDDDDDDDDADDDEEDEHDDEDED